MTRRATIPDRYEGFAFPKPGAKIKGISGKKPLDVRVMEFLEIALGDKMNTPEGRRVMNWIRPRAERAGRKRENQVAKAIDRGNSQALPKSANSTARKRELREECEELCKAIVFHRDGVSNDRADDNYRVGRCITCGHEAILQWGHFIPQERSKSLWTTPDNSGGQCSRCNGPGKGMYREYKEAINARSPGLADALEEMHKRHLRSNREQFRWTIRGLEVHRNMLKAECVRLGIPLPGEGV